MTAFSIFDFQFSISAPPIPSPSPITHDRPSFFLIS